MVLTRNSFKLFVTIDSALTNVQNFLQQHKGYPIDNVIQIKLSKKYFTTLFKGDILTSTSFEQENLNARYNSEGLLQRLKNFFSKEKYNNYNSFASDITTLIQNTYNDIDINPVKLEHSCKENGEIFNYFFLSPTSYNSTRIDYEDLKKIEHMYDDTSSQVGGIKVYQLIARELDNMISRNVNLNNILQQSTSLEYQYSELDQLYTVYNDEFWNNIQEGDSIFIEGSFEVPTNKPHKTYKNQKKESYNIIGNANLPIIVQFVCSELSAYNYGFQIPPTMLLIGTTNFTFDTFVSGLYIDDGASATDFTDVEENITNDIIASVTKDSQLLGSNLSLSVDNNGNIITTEINEIIPTSPSGLFSVPGSYSILYKVTDVDGFTDSSIRDFNITYSGSIQINNDPSSLQTETYYKKFSNNITISHILYEDPSATNTNTSVIFIPYKSNGYLINEIPDVTLSLLPNNSGHVEIDDPYSIDINDFTISIQTNRTNIGVSDTQQTFDITNNLTNKINDNILNLIAIDIEFNTNFPTSIEHEILTSANSVDNLPDPETTNYILVKEPTNQTYQITDVNKNISVTNNYQYTFDSTTYNSYTDLKNAVNTFIDNNQSTANYTIVYSITRTFNNTISLQTTKNLTLSLT